VSRPILNWTPVANSGSQRSRPWQKLGLRELIGIMPRLTFTRPGDERNAWCLWLALFVMICLGISLGDVRSVAAHYSQAARDWGDGQPLYNGWGVGFIYLPQAAILHLPFGQLPRVPDEILWRALTIGIYALGLRRLCALSEQDHHVRLFPMATCVSIPLAFAAARNGQATLLLAGLLMLAVDDLVCRRWNRSAAFLCLAFAFKPLALPLVLVIATLHRPMTWRVTLGMLTVAVVPYLTQDWRYVTGQYTDCTVAMRIAAEIGTATPWAHLFGLLEIAGLALPVAVQMPLCAAAGAAVLGLNWLALRRLPAHRAGILLFSLTTTYLLLFNPRTENNTYAFLAPALGLCCGESFLVRQNWRVGALYLLIASGILGSYELGKLLAPQAPPVWPAPLMAVGFLAMLTMQLRREIRRSLVASTEPATPTTCAQISMSSISVWNAQKSSGSSG
jgi:hypothetical protein